MGIRKNSLVKDESLRRLKAMRAGLVELTGEDATLVERVAMLRYYLTQLVDVMLTERKEQDDATN